MIDNLRKISDHNLWYRAPQIKVIDVKVQDILCQSGSEPMPDVDYGNAGFSEE